ncbi:MAG: hypothetical protein DRP75_02325, partial [Candidatus Omnitrophota bacterium]
KVLNWVVEWWGSFHPKFPPQGWRVVFKSLNNLSPLQFLIKNYNLSNMLWTYTKFDKNDQKGI